MYHTNYTSAYGTHFNENGQQNYLYMQGLPQNDAIPLLTVEQHKNEEKNVEAFLLTVEQFSDLQVVKTANSAPKIGVIRKALTSVTGLNKKLESIYLELKHNENLLEDVWQEKVEISKKLQLQIQQLLEPFKNPMFMRQLQKGIENRKKKRLREKSKRNKCKSDKKLNIERRSRLHAEIDSWIRKERAVIEKEKQDENLRREADLILSDVRGKRSDTRKFLGLLNELKILRNIKANVARARGEHLSSAVEEAFNSITDKLMEQWQSFDREYSIEEQGLKLMLQTDNEKRIERQKKNAFDDWEKVLFGRKILTSDQLNPGLNSLIANRCAWDKYVSSDYGATSIPIGWVLPDKPSSAAWQKCLEKEAL